MDGLLGSKYASDIIHIKIVCRVQIWKETSCQNSDKFG